MKLNLMTFVVLVVIIAIMVFGGRYFSNRIRAQHPANLSGDPKGQLAPDFQLKDLNGKTLQLSDFRGKVVLLNFWATWCPPCQEEMPWFIDLQQRYGPQGLQVIGVAMEDSEPKVIGVFTKKLGVNYPIVLGKEAVAKAYGGIDFLPNTFYIGRNGRIVSRVQGIIDRKETEEMVKKALASQNQTTAAHISPRLVTSKGSL